MREITRVAEAARCTVHDANLKWGAKVSDYNGPLFTYGPKWAGDGYPRYEGGPDPRPTALLVELFPDVRAPRGAVMVDHHGTRAGEPPALIQVCRLLGITPTRRQNLIGAFDAAYIYGLRAIGATTEEIRGFLGASEKCKTVGEMLTETENYPEEIIREAEQVVKEAEQVGDCIVVRCNHNKTASITARMFDKQEKQNILILSEWTDEGGKEKTEANYFASGEDVRSINNLLPGWTGGAGLLPPTETSKAYWSLLVGNRQKLLSGEYLGRAMNLY